MSYLQINTDILHISGRSEYIDDIPLLGHVLQGYVVSSQHAHALIKSIDIDRASKFPGVCCILTAASIPGENNLASEYSFEPVLADKTVEYYGQAVCLIAADSIETAFRASLLINIQYELLDPVITINDAISAGKIIGSEIKIESGNVAAAFENTEHIISGKLITGPQEHWYPETQVAIALPTEGKCLKILSTTQNPLLTRSLVAQALNIPYSGVEVSVRRTGRGSAARETQASRVAAWAALLANACRRPVKMRLTWDHDFMMTGKCHSFLVNYKAGFNSDGKILAAEIEFNSNVGAARDLSLSMMKNAMLNADNCYFIPDVKITGKVWRTNLPPNTDSEGSGAPQALAAVENIMERIAGYLKKDTVDIRLMNIYRNNSGEKTPSGQIVVNNNLSAIWYKLSESSLYHERILEIEQYNTRNEFTKRGIATVPVKCVKSFIDEHLYYPLALISILPDGSVLMYCAKVESGQGIHNLAREIVADKLGLNPDKIVISDYSTNFFNCFSPSFAGPDSYLCLTAVMNAVNIIRDKTSRLAAELLTETGCSIDKNDLAFGDEKIYSGQNPSHFINFKDVVSKAFKKHINLSAEGIVADRETGIDHPAYTMSFGMAVTEVKVDLLTGHVIILRTDIIESCSNDSFHDILKSHIAGGFMRGIGWICMENYKCGMQGEILNSSPVSSKIPLITDLPVEMNIHFINQDKIKEYGREIFLSEDSHYMMAVSCWLAIRNALFSVGGYQTDPDLPVPATPEVILNTIDRLKNSVNFRI